MTSTDAKAEAACRMSIRDRLRRIPWLLRLKRYVWLVLFGSTRLHVLRAFPLHTPNSSGRYAALATLTMQSINQVFPFLSSLATDCHGPRPTLQPLEDFPSSEGERAAASRLKVLFDRHGSDKSTGHAYHHLYGVILKDATAVSGIFEIGLGTNRTDVVSNMGRDGRPGASLRAFRELCPNAQIYGADVDERILFSEDRIRTFHVDQTDPSTFDLLQEVIPNGLDLVIDDGLHSPNANLTSLRFGLSKIKTGGWVVIEDIHQAAVPVWEVVAALLPSEFRCHLLTSPFTIAFAVQKQDRSTNRGDVG
ncbi:MAG: hypothetical protein ACKOTB_12915 [Planctomycetia bacterium]